MANEDQPIDRREALLASFDAAEAEVTNADVGATATFDAATGEEVSDGRARDEHGRFAPKASEVAPEQPVAAQPAMPAEPAAAPAVPETPKPSLTTWKKEYLPLQQKLASGQPLTPEEATKLAQYNIERESQYSTGVSTYRAEAQQAKHLTEAMNEFMPDLQQHGIEPAQWIQNLGRAHQTLVKGSPEQKLQMFARLAQDYGIPLPAVTQAAQGQMDPIAMSLMEEIQRMKDSVTEVTSWRQQQQQAATQQELAKFKDATQYPHFEQVRGEMAQLLEFGFAQNLDEAYAKAVRLNDTAWTAEQGRQAAAQAATLQAQQRAAVSKAKASAGQVRTATPSVTQGSAKATDRRAALAEAFEATDHGRV